MLTTPQSVDFAYTRQELKALFWYAREHDIEQGGRYDARSTTINLWTHGWRHPATHAEIIGTFYVRWGDTLTLWLIETEAGFSLDDLMEELGRLELAALGYVKHGDVSS